MNLNERSLLILKSKRIELNRADLGMRRDKACKTNLLFFLFFHFFSWSQFSFKPYKWQHKHYIAVLLLTHDFRLECKRKHTRFEVENVRPLLVVHLNVGNFNHCAKTNELYQFVFFFWFWAKKLFMPEIFESEALTRKRQFGMECLHRPPSSLEKIRRSTKKLYGNHTWSISIIQWAHKAGQKNAYWQHYKPTSNHINSQIFAVSSIPFLPIVFAHVHRSSSTLIFVRVRANI